MTAKAQHDWEALGREATEAGFEYAGEGHEALHIGRDDRGYPAFVPDFRHEPTALACIPWFASHYPDHDISIDYYRDGTVTVTAAKDGTGGNTMDAWHDFDGATLPHACIAAVKAALETAP